MDRIATLNVWKRVASMLLLAGTLAGGCTTQTTPPAVESTQKALTGPAPDLAIIVASASTVALSWSDVTGEIGYYVDRSTDGGLSFTQVQNLGADAHTWTDTARSALTTYCYRVRAFDGAGSSTSNTSCVLMPKAYEAESLTRTTSSATASVVSNAGASGGSLLSATVGSVGGWVELTTTTPATGVYGTKIRYLATPDAGRFVVKVGGAIYGSEVDGYVASPSFREVYLGEVDITTASVSRKLRFELTGRNPLSTGNKIQIDVISMLVAQFRYEGESLSVSTSSGDSQSDSNVSGASNGKVNVATLNAVGDYVRYTIGVGAPGTYSVSLQIRKGTSRGRFRAWLDETTALGSEVDGYASSNTLVVVPLGEIPIATAGSHTIKLQVTGKNSSASNYGITVDRIDLRLATGNGCSFFGAFIPEGTACNDASLCTQNDVCQIGRCTGTSSVTCTASDQCHQVGICDPGTGQCSNPAKPDGSICDDDNPCTQTDTCQVGACTGSNPVTCTATDQCHEAGTCDQATGRCINLAKPDGSVCNDGNPCTQTDTCQAGACTGTNLVTCSPSDECHEAGTCDPGTGQCSNPVKPNGSACNDGNPCTRIDTCQVGICTGTDPVICTPTDQCHGPGICDQVTGTCSNPAKPDGTACNDGNACTLNDFCQTGTCTGRDPVVCSDWGPCYGPAVCDPEFGNCRATAKADGTSCDDGNPCTQTDSCQAGTCAGSNPVTCTASDQCHEAGTCDQGTGQCSNPPKIGACLRNSPKISAGSMHTCAIRADGSIACWGNNSLGQATPPAGTFKEVSAGEGITCGIKTDGTPQCWGGFGYPPGFPPGETFVQISAGSHGACGLRPGGSVQCWGYLNGSSYRTHTQIASGLNHGCGVLEDGTLDCWGEIDWGLPNPPAGTFVQVVAGAHRSCALRTDGTPACWGQDAEQNPPPALTFERLAAAGNTTCGLQTSGEVVCWGTGSLAQLTPPVGPFVNLTVGNYHACATRSDDSSVCWGAEYDRSDPWGATTLPVGQIRQVSTAMDSGCRLDVTGHVSCWGARQFTPPASTFRQISVSQTRGCGILTDGTGACWCWPDSYTCMVPTWAGPFAQVSVSEENVCWLNTEGVVVCTMGSYPPPGVYKQVTALGTTACAVRADDTAVCWGDNPYGKAVPPEGTWKQLSVGAMHSCGIKTDDTVVCWGDNSYGQGSAPSGSFSAVAAGSYASCAIRTDGSIACWGRTMSTSNPPSPPPGPFQQLSVGMNYGYDGFCATSTSGQEWCWGEVARQPLTCALEPDGTCLSTDPVVCEATDQCHTQGVFDPATRRCTNPAAPDGTSCSDGSACTQTDTCQAGVCTGANPVTCEAPLSVCQTNTCDPMTGQCVSGPKPDGTSCDDGNACSQTDTCQAGWCTGGNLVVCPGSNGPCRYAGWCDPSTGQCGPPAIATNGTVCEDGNACTLNDTCQNGECTAGNPLPCAGEGECHQAGTCNPANGQCSYSAKAEGASCDDRNPCTENDTCQAGTCNGSASGGTCQVPTTGALAGGYTHTCALRADGTVACWGSNYQGESTPPSGTFQQIVAGYSFTCALRADGTPQCWGTNTAGETDTLPGPYTQLAAGAQQICGLTATGQAECWGNRYMQWPSGTFTQISLAPNHGCGLVENGSISCWSTSWMPVSPPPSGTGFRKVAAGVLHSCAITAERDAVCWGDTLGTPPPGPFIDIVAGYQHACALRSNGTVACWGPTYGSPPPGAFVTLTAGTYHTCAMRGDGSVACWGQDGNGQSTVPSGTFSQVAAGNEFCNLASDGSVGCWGRIYPSGEPTGSFVQVAGGSLAQCGIRTDGSIACWDYGMHGPTMQPVPTGSFTQLSVGEATACAVKDDGTLACWGDTIQGTHLNMPVTNDFVEVAVGGGVACARKTTGRVTCWGYYNYGAPDLLFTKISTGYAHACGLTTSGEIVCWGDNWAGQTSPPAGNNFVQVASQASRSCAVTEQGAAVCWGYFPSGDPNGGSTRIGPLVQISMSYDATCGLNASGQLLCWGGIARQPL